jgi:antirestriction protein ArdC
MPRTYRSAADTSPRLDICRTVTDEIIAQLEKGSVPWVQPWDCRHAAIGLPYNAASRRRYSGINILTLWNAAASRGFSGQGFLTFRRAAELGGTVRRGERGTAIVYARRVPGNSKGSRTGDQEEESARGFSVLRTFTVFSTDQCEGLPEQITIRPEAATGDAILPEATALIAATGADFRIGGPNAFYDPVRDFVAVPPPEAFHEAVNWHRTAFHELAHWTGRRSRLNRDQSGAFGSAAYGQEELVAEMAGAFVCAALGIRPTVRHADYIGSWLAILKEDHRAILRAASAASRASDYLLALADAAHLPASAQCP